jgi:hypothetical protein
LGKNPLRLEFPQVNLSENWGKLLKFPPSAEIDERDGEGNMVRGLVVISFGGKK